MALVSAADTSRLGVVLDTYHMHREEADPVDAIRSSGARLRLVQLSDSGEIDFAVEMGALVELGYAGPLILECSTLAGPSLHIRPIDLDRIEDDLRASSAWLRAYRVVQSGALKRRKPTAFSKADSPFLSASFS